MDKQITCSSAAIKDGHAPLESQASHEMAFGNKTDVAVEQQTSSGNSNGNDKEVAFDIQGRLNPMFIPSIINHVVSFLPCSDLKRCRLLNKQWEEECTKHLRHKGIVKLASKSAVDEYCNEFHEKPKIFSNFSFETLSKGIDTSIFFTIFGEHIKCFKVHLAGECQQLPTKALFSLVFTKLPNLLELSLVGCISDDDHFLPKELRAVKANGSSSDIFSNKSSNKDNSTIEEAYQGPFTKPTLPLLKHLEIFLYNSAGRDVSKHQFLIELLGCVPNMERISVPKVPRMLSFGMPLLHTLVTTSELCFPKLSHLDMDIALYNGLMDVLFSKQYPLKYLNAEINSAVTENSLHVLLESFGKTLETLQLKFPRCAVASSEFRSAAKFQCLKQLTLHGYKGSLQFLEQLGCLESFEIIDNSFTAAMNRMGFSKPLKVRFDYKMIWTDWQEEVYAFDYANSSDAQLLQRFSKNFLNLTSLNLPHLNDNDLRVIYDTFSHSLQELTMENSLCSDCGLTGLPPVTLMDNQNGNAEKLDLFREQPFIGNLTRLRRLEILTPSVNFTDASIAFGVIHCENLKVLILRNAGAITDTGLRKSVDFLKLEKLETTMCVNIRGPGVKYALEKMTERGMTYIWNKHQGRLTNCCIKRILDGNAPVTCIVP